MYSIVEDAKTTNHFQEAAADTSAVVLCSANDIALNGSMGAGAGWTLDAGWAIVAGAMTITTTNNTDATQDFSLSGYSGASYFAKWTHSGVPAEENLGAGILVGAGVNLNDAHTTDGTKQEWVDATTGPITVFGLGVPSGLDCTAIVDNFSFTAYEATAVAAGQRTVIDQITCGFSATPTTTNPRLAIVDENGVHLWSTPIATAGPRQFDAGKHFPKEFHNGDGEGLGVVLSSGGATIVGNLNVFTR